MKQNIGNRNTTKSDYRLLFEKCPQCGKEVVLPCKFCLREETNALLSIHYADPDQQRRYEEVFAYNRRHGRPMFSSPPDDQQDDDALTLVRDFPDSCWRLP
jgi:hypothetical protein